MELLYWFFILIVNTLLVIICFANLESKSYYIFWFTLLLLILFNLNYIIDNLNKLI